MYRDDFVSIWIAEVCKIDFARGPFAPTGWVLDALSAVGDAGVVERLDLLGAGAGETDSTAVCMCRCLAVDRFGNAERTSLRAIPNTALRMAWPAE